MEKAEELGSDPHLAMLIYRATPVRPGKYSFYPRTIALWNNIPLSFTNIDNLDTFKLNALSFIRSD